jgi:hypothetical protein
MLPRSPHRLLRGVDAIMPGDSLSNNSLFNLQSLFDDTVSKVFVFVHSNISEKSETFSKSIHSSSEITVQKK